eukprot:UN03377
MMRKIKLIIIIIIINNGNQQQQTEHIKPRQALPIIEEEKRELGARIPIIMHNGSFDLMFCYAHFQAQLPTTFNAFAHEISLKLFPNGVYDTKYLFVHPLTTSFIGYTHFQKLPNNSLGGLYEYFISLQAKQQQLQSQITDDNNNGNNGLLLTTNVLTTTNSNNNDSSDIESITPLSSFPP